MAGKLSMLRGRAKRIAAAACASALALFALTSVAMPSTAMAAEEEPVFQPDVQKSVVANTDDKGNPDGTYTLSLSVTGKQKSSEETVSQKADVILVMDLSTTMKEDFGQQGTRLSKAKEAAIKLVEALIPGDESDDIQIAFVPFGTKAKVAQGLTNEKSKIVSAINDIEVTTNNKTDIGGGTNWESGLGIANTLGRTGVTKHIVFLSDGQPENRCIHEDANGNTLEFDTSTKKWGYKKSGNWNEVPASEHVIDYKKEDGGFTNIESVKNYWHGVDAGKRRDANSKFYSVSLGNDDGLNDTMYKFQKEVTGSYDGYYSGNNPEELIKAFENISQSIVKTVAFKDVKVTDTLNAQYAAGFNKSGNLLDAGKVDPSVFTYETKKSGENNWTSWEPAEQQKATFNDKGEIVWDLSSMNPLPADVTYKVSFKIAPTQAAFNKAYSDNKDSFTFKSNGPAFATYKTITTVGGEEQDGPEARIDLESGEMTAALTDLTIEKVWADGKDTHTTPVTVSVAGSELVAKSVTLGPDAWTQTIKVPAGPTGHTYTLTELDVPGYKATYSKNNFELKGFETDGKKLAQGVTVTNTRSTGSLSITKYVSGSAANTTEHFTFELSASGDLAELLNGDYDAKYAVDGETTSDTGEGHPSKITFANGATNQKIQLRHNETVTIEGLPAGVTITVTEDTTDKAYSRPSHKVNDDNAYAEGAAASTEILTSPAVTKVYFKNTANAAPDNGISSDSTPMVGLFAVAAIGGTALYAANRGKRGQDAWKE